MLLSPWFTINLPPLYGRSWPLKNHFFLTHECLGVVTSSSFARCHYCIEHRTQPHMLNFATFLTLNHLVFLPFKMTNPRSAGHFMLMSTLVIVEQLLFIIINRKSDLVLIARHDGLVTRISLCGLYCHLYFHFSLILRASMVLSALKIIDYMLFQ